MYIEISETGLVYQMCTLNCTGKNQFGEYPNQFLPVQLIVHIQYSKRLWNSILFQKVLEYSGAPSFLLCSGLF